MAQTAVSELSAAEVAEKKKEDNQVAIAGRQAPAEQKAIEGSDNNTTVTPKITRPWLPWERRPNETPKSKPREEEEILLTRELLSRAKEAFSTYDEDGDNYIHHQYVINALRGTGFNPAEKEVERLIELQDPRHEYGELIDFNTFISILTKVSRIGDTEEEQEEAFSVWDRVGTGNINAMFFRRTMTSRGEKLTDADVDEMLKLVKIGEKGEFKYNELIKAMLSE